MNVCIFCSSANEANPEFLVSAFRLGAGLARSGSTIIHGGAKGGLMGRLTEGALSVDNDAEVIGVVTDEVRVHEQLAPGGQRTIYTSSLQDRKREMIDRADSFVVLPGGFGTLDEATEVVTRAQLGLLWAPITFVNLDGYWDFFIRFIHRAEKENMIITRGRDTFRVVDSVESYLNGHDG